MTDITPTNNIFSTYRAFPDDGCTGYPVSYRNVVGNIVNNVITDGAVGPDTSCPVVLELPTWDGNTGYSQTCEETYYGWTGVTGGPQCELAPLDVTPRYRLSSLQLLTKNLVNGSVAAVDPNWLPVLGSANQVNNFNEELDNGCTYKSSYTSDANSTYNFVYDGLLAPVYHINYASRCSIYNNNETLKYFITPYAQNTDSDPTNNRVKGTQYFTIGSGKNPCTCVALLNFGNVLAHDDEEKEIQANLYWNNIKLHTKNKYGNVCIKRPVTLHIEHGPDNGLNCCFTPYFAHQRRFPVTSDKTDDDCIVPTYVCDGTVPSVPEDTCFEMVFVSECVDINQLGLVSDDLCNYCTYIVLIPKPKLLV
jgi:hypothetical protein